MLKLRRSTEATTRPDRPEAHGQLKVALRSVPKYKRAWLSADKLAESHVTSRRPVPSHQPKQSRAGCRYD